MENPKFATRAVQSGLKGHIVPPIHTSKTSPWGSLDEEGMPSHKYSRSTPDLTVQALENLVSYLHNGAEAIAIGSGQGGTADILHTVKKGEHIIAGEQIYGGTIRFIEEILSRWASCDFVDPNNLQQLESVAKPNTRFLLIETPTNPTLNIIDLEIIRKFSEKRGIPYILDNTFATMVLLDGFNFGAETVYYSASKYIRGLHDAIGGLVVTTNKQLAEEIRLNRKLLGNALAPEVAYKINEGFDTLELRMARHCENAQKVAEYLAKHPMVSKVYYPGLITHPGHEIAKKQMKGFGGIVSFEIEGDYKKFAEAIASQDTHVIYLSESLGSTKSLLAHPAAMSHSYMSAEKREAIGIKDNLFRLSVGIENPEDILYSLERAFDTLKNVRNFPSSL